MWAQHRTVNIAFEKSCREHIAIIHTFKMCEKHLKSMQDSRVECRVPTLPSQPGGLHAAPPPLPLTPTLPDLHERAKFMQDVKQMKIYHSQRVKFYSTCRECSVYFQEGRTHISNQAGISGKSSGDTRYLLAQPCVYSKGQNKHSRHLLYDFPFGSGIHIGVIWGIIYGGSYKWGISRVLQNLG